ncbi:Protein of uncharacterized function (DUF692) [Candidatus Xenohaliotis californiensis]|uniref:Protein of uncharacterized function (DUF692) n=1 Tax=Candidatus Xenohaliotis californiensis TaxID=84677 RepID=A0ABP0ETM0_9RICK|nr:Protein of uncharacterized function (DUF692) [Candidatus Xenohaliotis californiensis]
MGIGLKREHYEEVAILSEKVDFLEVHAENFMVSGGKLLDFLLKVRSVIDISLHCVAISLGSAFGIDVEYLHNLKNLINVLNPFLVSDHLSWSKTNQHYLPDLIPVPYNKESLDLFCRNVDYVQNFLNIDILIENPSSYLQYKSSNYSESFFLNKIANKTGAGILLDINNLFVSCFNHGWDINCYLQELDFKYIKQIHLAGHSNVKLPSGNILKIDTHNAAISGEVWNIYDKFLALSNELCPPTLIEWDANVPSVEILLKEAQKVHEHVALQICK